MNKTFTLIGAAAALAAISLTAVAQDAWPTKPITMVIGFSAGGSTDIGARMVGSALAEELGVPVVAENRTGGSGQVGYNAMLASAPDGYTFSTISASAIVGPLDPSIEAPYTKDSFAPIARVVFDPNVLVVRADSPWQSLEDVLNAAKEAPNTITISQVGPTGGDALMRVLLEEASGAKFASVSYPDGATTVTTALLAGDLAVMVANVGDVVEFEEAGQVRTLGVASDVRSPFLENVPTFAEQGYDVVVGSSRGFAFPAGTPETVVNQVSDAIGTIMQNPEFVARMEAANLQAAYMNATEYKAFWDAETTLWQKHIDTLLSQAQ